MAIKRISIDALTTGMYVVRLDRPWPEQCELAEKHLIKSQSDITVLRKLGVLHVTIDPTLGNGIIEASSNGKLPEWDPLARDLSTARAVRGEAMTVLQGVFEGVKTGTPINSVQIKETVHTLMTTILRLYDPLLGLIHMQSNDTNMFTHAINVCAFALVVGKNQGFDKIKLEHLGVGALLHDVGELRLPRNLFRKRGAYTDNERRLMQQHPLLGIAILSQSDDVHDESRRIVLEHHERLDGSGYPNGIEGLAISPLSEIVGIADIYDGMISNRMGRPPLPPSQAIKEIYQHGLKGHVSREWAEAFIRCFGIYPVGSVVELSTGERGIVVATSPLDALRPTVRILQDSAQNLCAKPLSVDLANPKESEPERTILRVLDPAKENPCVGTCP